MEHKPSLKSILSGVVTGMLCTLLVGNLVLDLISTRSLLEEQLHEHSQDSATSLGLALSTVGDARDLALAERIIGAVFDSGDFARVEYFDTSGASLLLKESASSATNVPDWFVQLAGFEVLGAKAKVMSGWSQLGDIELIASADRAYSELWDAFLKQLGWFVLVLVLTLFIVRIVFNQLLRPLLFVEMHASNLREQNFDSRLDEPGTRELSHVVSALNEMAVSLGSFFKQQVSTIEELKAEAFVDTLTQLSNREAFDRKLAAELKSAEASAQGTLILIKLNGLEALNYEQGRNEIDQLLVSVASEIVSFIDANDPDGFASRRSGSDFAMYLPSVWEDLAEEVAERLMGELVALPLSVKVENEGLISVGVASSHVGDDLQGFLSKADLALGQAQSVGRSAWKVYEEPDSERAPGYVKSASEWHELLNHVIDTKAVELHYQKVLDLHTGGADYYQVLARIDDNGSLAMAGEFFPMARRFGLSTRLDKVILEKVFELATKRRVDFGVALTEESVQDREFGAWLADLLSKDLTAASRLRFHLPESSLVFHEDSLARVCSLLHSLKAQVVIERFGASSASLSYLRRLRLDAIRVDPSYVREVDVNKDAQFFLRSVIQLAKSQKIRVIAVGIESEDELAAVRDLGVDAGSGYFVGSPQSAADQEFV